METVTVAMNGLTLDLDADSIRRALESLPQEIYDQIYVAVFTAPAGIRKINLDMSTETMKQASSLLQVSSASRSIFAKSYYGCSDIIVQGYKSSQHLQRWIKSLSKADHTLLQRVVVLSYSTDWRYWDGGDCIRRTHAERVSRMRNCLSWVGARFAEKVFFTIDWKMAEYYEYRMGAIPEGLWVTDIPGRSGHIFGCLEVDDEYHPCGPKRQESIENMHMPKDARRFFYMLENGTSC